MFFETSSDIFRQILDLNSILEIMTKINLFESLKEYTNSSLSKISVRYTCVTPRILEDWKVSTLKT